MKIISLWSGPRNVSTALMYSFAQRTDTEVIDEPLYGHYLSGSSAHHPGQQELLLKLEKDGRKVINKILDYENGKGVLFLKNMAHHFIGFDEDNDFLDHFQNIFLIRDPEEMLPSLAKQIPDPVLRDTGLKKQVEILKILESKGKTPIIINCKTLLKSPESTLRKVCDYLDIPFYTEMLRWEKGARPEDGIWAKHWYQRVHDSTGFTPYIEKSAPFPAKLNALLEECNPYYEYLNQRSINPNS